MPKNEILVTHTKPDLSEIAGIWLLTRKAEKNKEKSVLFFKEGNEELNHQIEGITLVGRFESGAKRENPFYSIVKKLGLENDEIIQELASFIRKSEEHGVEPFDIADFAKCMKRDIFMPDKEILEIGLRIIQDVVNFRKNNLSRENSKVREIILDFLKKKPTIPPTFERYLELLSNPTFKRPFDLVEVATAEMKEDFSKAQEIVNRLLERKYRDTEKFFEALRLIEQEAIVVKTKGLTICAAITNNPKFNPAARTKGADIIIQKTTDGHNQIYFNFSSKKIPPGLPDAIISALRLEECLIQNRKIPPNLKMQGKIPSIPEWYYRGKGSLILNGSLTAPYIPRSKIPWGTIIWLVKKIVQYYPVDWTKWRAARIAQKNRKKK